MEKIDKSTLQLVYDENCPLCNWYTDKFIRYHFLEESGRVSWTIASQNAKLDFDRDLSRNKIALLKDGVAIKYGVEGLLEVLSIHLPVIGRIGELPIIRQFLLILYNLISYNRKVIAPSYCDGTCECIPDSKPVYRWVFIVFAGIVVNVSTGIYFREHLYQFYAGVPVWTEAVLYAGQFILMYLVFVFYRKQKQFLNYAGNLATISLIGSGLLLFFHILLLVLSELNIQTTMLAPFFFGVVFFAMWLEHRRRLSVLHFDKSLSGIWLVYRIFIYPFAFAL